MTLKIDNVIEEIERALAGNKPKYANDIYLNNAIRYLQEIKSPSLTDDQQVVLDWLKYPLNDIPNRFAENYFAYVTCLFLGQAPDKVLKAYQELSPEQQLEVLAAFAEWGMKNDQED